MDISATNKKRKYPWVIFGSDKDDKLDIESADIIENNDDYIFAGKGNDELNGRGGNDYLEGGPALILITSKGTIPSLMLMVRES